MLRIASHASMPLYASRAVAGSPSDFSVSKSPLRTESRGAEPVRDPAEDSVELTQRYGALVASQAYPTPPPQLQGVSLGARQDRREDGELGEGGGLAEEEADTEAAAEAGAGEGEAEEARPGQATDARGEPLDEREQQQLRELENRDREVRAHEQAHKSAGGQYAGAVSYEFQQGPDGQRYAVGGEVSIDVSKEDDPSATISKMRQVRAAAMAPAEPSSQDHSVAAQAMQTEAEARQELVEQRSAEGGGEGGEAAAAGERGEGGDGEAAGESAVGAADSSSASVGDVSSARPSSSAVRPPTATLSESYEPSAPYSPRASRMATGAFGYTPIDVFA